MKKFIFTLAALIILSSTPAGVMLTSNGAVTTEVQEPKPPPKPKTPKKPAKPKEPKKPKQPKKPKPAPKPKTPPKPPGIR